MKAEPVVAEIADSVEEIIPVNDVITVIKIFEFFSLKIDFVLDFFYNFFVDNNH